MSVVVLVPGYGGRFRLVERWRVGIALRTLSDHGGGMLVVSGHQGEAQRLAALVPPGVPVLEETEARSTFENVSCFIALLEAGGTRDAPDAIAIGTDRFHGRRAVRYLDELRPDLAGRVVPPSRVWWRGWWMDAAGAAYEVVLKVRPLVRRRRST